MSGPLVFWPNRKSSLGLRKLSRVPRQLRTPAWFTDPPIQKRSTNDSPDRETVLRASLLEVADALCDQEAIVALRLGSLSSDRLAATVVMIVRAYQEEMSTRMSEQLEMIELLQKNLLEHQESTRPGGAR